MFDLRRLGKVDHLSMVGVNGSKYPAIRKHLDENIGQAYKDMDTSWLEIQLLVWNLVIYEIGRFVAYPEEGKTDPEACAYWNCTSLEVYIWRLDQTKLPLTP